MPPRKEPKETVTYPASKRKPLPFKPHRPAKLTRTSTEGSESSSIARNSTSRPGQESSEDEANTHTTAKQSTQPARTASIANDEPSFLVVDQTSDSSSDDLPDDPLKAKRLPPRRSNKQHKSKQTEDHRHAKVTEQELIPETSEANISQALLLRLMHEHFKAKETQIDKHAIKVVQRYVDIFLRESVARAALSQKDEVKSGIASQSDTGWLDSKDLEKVSGGIILDF